LRRSLMDHFYFLSNLMTVLMIKFGFELHIYVIYEALK
jgi:hypothetical protein